MECLRVPLGVGSKPAAQSHCEEREVSLRLAGTGGAL